MTDEMAELHFTSWLREIVPNGPLTAGGDTVGAALGAVFAELPHVRGYVLDERGQLRKHVCIFADGKRLAARGGARAKASGRIRSSTSCRLLSGG